MNPNSLSLDETLPDDTILTILAKVSRSYYPFLSLVCRKFRFLINSIDLYMIRSSLGTVENTVFVRLKLSIHEDLRWYNLWTNPNTSKRLLVPTNRSYSFVHSVSLACVDSSTYVIGGQGEFKCTIQRFYQKNLGWCQESVPNMKVARKNAFVYPMREKIYVMGGCNDSETTNWGEVFDVKTQTWESFMCPGVLRGYKIYKIEGFGSRLYVWTDTIDYRYDINEDKWDVLEERLSRSKSWCFVNKIAYQIDHKDGLLWYDSNIIMMRWRKVRGLSKLKYKYGIVKSKGMIEIIEYNKKLLVFWDKYEKRGRGSMIRSKKIWCAEISLEKRNDGWIWGNIEWIDDVLTLSNSYDFANCLCRAV